MISWPEGNATMRRFVSRVLIAAAVLVVTAPAPARADAFFGPWIGATFARSADLRAGDNGSTSFGAFLGSTGGELVGYDIDFGYTSKFFGPSADFGDNTLITIMANLIVGPMLAAGSGREIRPYAAFGIGLIRSQAKGGSLFKTELADNVFGWDAGAGVLGYLTSRVGLRGDVRYFHTVANTSATNTILLKPGNFHFWRGFIGVVVR